MSRTLPTLFALMLIFASGAYAQNCADIDGNNRIDVGDAVYMISEHIGGAPIPAGKGDIDFRQGYNAGDLRFFIDYIFGGGPTPGCPPFPPYTLVHTNDSLILPSYEVPAGSGQFALPIALINHATVHDIVLPMQVNSLGSTVFFDSLKIASSLAPPLRAESVLDSTGIIVYSSNIYYSQGIVSGINLLAVAFFHYTSSPGGTISMDTVTIRPHTFLNYVYGDRPGLAIGIPKVVIAEASTFPEMIVEPDTLFFEVFVGNLNPVPQQFSIQSSGEPFYWTLTKPSWIGVDATSGVSGQNVSVTPNMAGLLVGVHYGDIIVSSPEALGSPHKVVVELTVLRPPSLDANCDGVLNYADIVAEVHYMFAGGSLCDPCTGEWPTGVNPQFVPLDANCDGVLNLADIIAEIKYLFMGGSVCDPCTGEWP